MDFNQLIVKVSQHYRNKLPFVLYSFPEKETVSALLQNDGQLHEIGNLVGGGFVFAPFNYKETAYFVPELESELFECECKNQQMDLPPEAIAISSVEKIRYLKLLTHTLETIQNKKATKIVISRKRTFPLKYFSIEELIKRLFSIYPKAFTYIWFHPQTGIWCGATPETLVKIQNNSFKTMALAGTQPWTSREPVLWGQKELDEQQLVTDAITTSLQRVTSVLKVSNPQTHRAGSLMHLRTDITGVLKNGKATIATIVDALHPTPAICGTPQKKAKEFILANEGYNRAFYTGFLGPISSDLTSATLMVNLRCMQISEAIANIFVGGGITTDSKPEAEWQETQNKMQIMLQVLQPML